MDFPIEWKQLLQQIVKTLHHKETSVVEIFPEIEHGRIVAFINFFKKVIPKKKIQN